MFVYMELSTIFKHCQVMKSWVGFGTRLIYMYMQFSTTHAHVVIREHVTSNRLLEEDQNMCQTVICYISRCTEGPLLNQLIHA